MFVTPITIDPASFIALTTAASSVARCPILPIIPEVALIPWLKIYEVRDVIKTCAIYHKAGLIR